MAVVISHRKTPPAGGLGAPDGGGGHSESGRGGRAQSETVDKKRARRAERPARSVGPGEVAGAKADTARPNHVPKRTEGNVPNIAVSARRGTRKTSGGRAAQAIRLTAWRSRRTEAKGTQRERERAAPGQEDARQGRHGYQYRGTHGRPRSGGRGRRRCSCPWGEWGGVRAAEGPPRKTNADRKAGHWAAAMGGKRFEPSRGRNRRAGTKVELVRAKLGARKDRLGVARRMMVQAAGGQTERSGRDGAGRGERSRTGGRASRQKTCT